MRCDVPWRGVVGAGLAVVTDSQSHRHVVHQISTVLMRSRLSPQQNIIPIRRPARRRELAAGIFGQLFRVNSVAFIIQTF